MSTDDKDAESAVMAFCHAKKHGKRVVGLRNTRDKRIAVGYIDMMGSPWLLPDGTPNPKVVLYIGKDMEDLLNKIVAGEIK